MLQIGVDSLKLQSDKILSGNENSSWEVTQSKPAKVYGEWELPNGDIPKKLFIGIQQQIGEDSTEKVTQEVPLDKVPVRYNQE
jgi:hypothetical protein